MGLTFASFRKPKKKTANDHFHGVGLYGQRTNKNAQIYLMTSLTLYYYMTSSVSGQDESNPVL